MRPPLAYICAPYRAADADGISANVAIAMTMARVALKAGRLPVVVHATVAAGGLGRDEVPEEREAGLKAACGLASWVADSYGEIWVCLPASGFPSEGMLQELRAFSADQRMGGCLTRPPAARWGTAADWLRHAEHGGAPALCSVDNVQFRHRLSAFPW